MTLTHGQSQSYTIRPQAGYKILAVKVDGESDPSGLDGSLTLANVSAGRTIEAVFGRTFALTSETTSGGTVQPLGVVAVDEGQDVEYTITPLAGYRIHSVLVDDVDSASAHHGSFTFKSVSAHHTLKARFIRTYAVSGTVDGGAGRGTLSLPSSRADSGGTFTVKFKPAAGFRFKALYDNGQLVKPTSGDSLYTLTGVTGPHDLVVHFLPRYTITLLPTTGGTLTADSLAVDSGQSVKVTLMPANPNPTVMHRFDSLFVNGVAVQATGRFGPRAQHDYVLANVASNQRVRVKFVRIFSITVINAGGPMATDTLRLVTKDGGAFIDSGGWATLNILPPPGRVLTSLQDNNEEVKGKVVVKTYTITGISENHAFVAAFAEGATYRVAMSTNFTPISGRVSYQAPQVCLRIAGKEACDTAWSLNVPAATNVSFRADTDWTLCGAGGGCSRFPWQAWEGLTPNGRPNPTQDILLDRALNVKARYSETGIPVP